MYLICLPLLKGRQCFIKILKLILLLTILIKYFTFFFVALILTIYDGENQLILTLLNLRLKTLLPSRITDIQIDFTILNFICAGTCIDPQFTVRTM